MQLREEYESIAMQCIDKYENLKLLKAHPCRIAFLGSSKEKKSRKRIIYADCTKVSQRYQWSCPYDFMITIYEPNCAGMDMDQLELLIWHELMHIGIEEKDTGEVKYFIQPHDVQDFACLILEKGIDWAE